MNGETQILDLSRGKPSKEMLDLSLDMLDCVSSKSDVIVDSIDTRNYGALGGLPSAKKLMGDILNVPAENVVVFGNSSLEIFYKLISKSFTHGVMGSAPWHKLKSVKWLCPVPGYDRHFSITEHFGIEMINIPMNDFGPDMDKVEELIKDPTVKGIWCVPQYSNPTGITYSKEVVKRFARLKPAAKDFRIYWDNAYVVHHLDERHNELTNLFEECKKTNNLDLLYVFTSTSKITFAGSGIVALAASKNNLQDVLEILKFETIGYDKVNQLRHVLFLKNKENTLELMKKHARILKPKFDLIQSTFMKELKGLATWSKPNGGYFITLYVNGIAKEVIAECKERGLILTEAGCAFPYHKDPDNSVIRIAPSYPSINELVKALNILCDCVKSLRREL